MLQNECIDCYEESLEKSIIITMSFKPVAILSYHRFDQLNEYQ